MLSPSKEESINQRATEAIEKVVVDTNSDDLTDGDIYSLLAISLANEAPKIDKKIDDNGDNGEESVHDCDHEFNGSAQSESQENFPFHDDGYSAGRVSS